MTTIVGNLGLVTFLPALLCGGGMVICMTLMGRGMQKENSKEQSAASVQSSDEATRDNDSRIADLEAEVARLREEREHREISS